MERQAEGPLSFYQRFLRITFRTFRCSCARARPRPHRHTSASVYTRPNTHISTHVPAFSFLSVLPLPPWSPRQPLVLSSFTLHAVLLLPLSPSFRAAFRSSSSSLLYVRVHTRVYVCTCASSQSSYARFHVARALRSRGERAALYVGERENVF